LNNKQYALAKKEIKKCLIITDDQKALDLSNRIDVEIKKQTDVLMGDAVLNYNSQKYEEALKMFNQILEIDRNNDIAMDYKSRIEKRLKALDL
jgi:tetratricopeptide (TPR) repeat protein